MRSTSVATLVVTALATAAIAWIGIERFYGAMPRLPWLPPLTMLGLALVEAVAASQTRARIERQRGAGPIQPLLVARYVVLAKASALAGAICAGAYVGLTGWLMAQRGILADADLDLPQSATGVAASIALVLAGLWLERSCLVPPSGGDQSGGGRSGGGAGTDPGETGISH